MKKINLIFITLLLFVIMSMSVSAIAPDLVNLTYVQSKTVSYNTEGMSSNLNGTYLYSYTNSDDATRLYNMSNGDISTLTYLNGKGTGDNGGRDIVVSPDGTKMYTLNSGSYARQYNLTTPYDMSTAVLHTQHTIPSSVNLWTFSQDGKHMYLGRLTESFEQWSLSTPWDLSTAVYNTTSSSFSATDNSWSGFEITEDGQYFILCGSTNEKLYLFNMSTPYDASTTSYTGISYDFSSQTTNPTDVGYSPEANKIYVGASTIIYEYSLPSTEILNVFNVTNIQTPNNLTTNQIGLLNINTSITDTLGELGNLNDSYTTLNYEVVSLSNNNCDYINLNDGSCNSLDTVENMTKNNNSEFSYSTYELNYLPAIYTFNQSWIQQQIMSEHIVKGTSFMRFNVHNMTTNTSHIVNIEYNIEPYSTSGEYSLLVLYCNSSYTTGDPDPVSEPNCQLVDEVLPNEAFNHCHSVESCHYVSRLNKDIEWTSSGYFMFGTLATATVDSWSVNYVENASYVTQSFSQTTNGGSSWTPSDHIADIHIHQFATTDNVNYNTTFYDGEGNDQTSEHTTDYFDFVNAPPSTFVINDPSINYTINSTGVDIFFSWENTTDPEEDNFWFRVAVTSNGLETLQNLSLLLDNGNLNYTHNFKSTQFVNGDYRAYVYAIDENGAYTLSPKTTRFNVCVNDWNSLLGVCSVDNNQSITWFDSNNCAIEYEKPTTTSQICDYSTSTVTDEDKYKNNLTIFFFIFIIIVILIIAFAMELYILAIFSGIATIVLAVFVNSLLGEPFIMLFLMLIALLQIVGGIALQLSNSK